MSSEKSPSSSEEQPQVAPSTGCLAIFKGIFGNASNGSTSQSKEQTYSEKNAQAYREMISTSSSSLPPAYEALQQEMSQLRVNGSSDIKLSDLWENNEFAKTVHHAIEAVSAELREISLKYDALPGIGHACGHNLIAISGVATAIGIKAVIEKFHLAAQVKLLGTPAEELEGGKIVMLNKGAFENLDVCMMLHGANTDVIYTNFLALDTVEVEFFGKASHASASPWEGINALDAAVLTYTNIGLMRQQMRPDQRVHGIIKDGGKAANIIPDYTKSVYTVRSPKYSEVEVLKKRVEAIFKGAAAATGCRVALKWGSPYMDILTNDPLARKFEHFMNAQGLKYAPKQEQQSKVSGSTDMGNVTYALPGIHPMFNILNLEGKDDNSMGLHTSAFASAASQPTGHIATLRAAKGLAMTGVECILDDEFLDSVKKDFESTK
ncbi:hypothetical protein BGZ80_003807 [Entomortierella chlamydospora]|uniref:Peptidase M20 dimerisation domain-containing protein n=1 Tax=Entomortierella chlamydospora TaxID=101097 RepID=A0A9P6MNK1_9FUNG|nr:hypothetical protein BGZ80_003807 [Entomortierella chlamydospora]